MKLYRTVSEEELYDYQLHDAFRTARNTLEGKQFFKTEFAVRTYKSKADIRRFRPPYEFLFVVDIDEDCFSTIDFEEQFLDDFEAVIIKEVDLCL